MTTDYWVVHPRHWLRWVPALCGAWLIASAYLWPHAPPAMQSTWLVGVLLVSFGLVSAYEPWVDIVHAPLALGLAVSTLLVEHVDALTLANNLLVAAAVLAASAGDPRWRRELSHRPA
ncbi:MAG: hypothetical protein K8M05_07825 [Deltaproteobacteria bacterium]|nr:hypothetical protein [Kofleriaceae bacterium]